MYDFQKANTWKRISAALFDFIMLVMVVMGVAYLMSTVINYTSYFTEYENHRTQYGEKYGIDFKISAEEYNALPEDERAVYDEASKEFSKDAEVNKTYAMLLNLTLVIAIFSILISYLLLEFLVPLLFKNGQTLGKKIFGIGVMRIDGVRLTPFLLFVRSILGKYTIETMIPVFCAVMIYFNSMVAAAVMVIGILLIVQLGLLIANRERTPIHDKLASTVTVDLTSQMIFATVEDLLAYKEKKAKEAAERAEY